MAFIMKCPSCQSALRIKEEYAGKQLKCPRCAHVMAIPKDKSAEEPEEAPQEAIKAPPRKSSPPPLREETIEEGEPPPRRANRQRRQEEDDDEDDRPAKGRRGKKHLAYEPCPRCGCTEATKVVWTPWGSFYGPAMFNHVRCQECGYAYNGRTGGSNIIPAIIFVTIPALLIAAIVGFLAYILITRLGGR